MKSGDTRIKRQKQDIPIKPRRLQNRFSFDINFSKSATTKQI